MTCETHEPAMFPNCENALINASATARLDGGRANVLDVQVRKQTQPANDCAIKKLTKDQVSAKMRIGWDTYSAI